MVLLEYAGPDLPAVMVTGRGKELMKQRFAKCVAIRYLPAISRTTI
jgi:hypothetical protein